MQTEITLSERQEQIIDHCRIGNGIRYVTVCTGRRVGKTTVAMMVAYNWCVQHKSFHVGFFMPSYIYCNKVFMDFKVMLADFIDVKIVTCTGGSPMIVKFANGSTISLYTASKEIRGPTFDALIVDEACMIEDYMWKILHVTVKTTFAKVHPSGNTFGKVLVVSTPKERNFFFRLLTRNAEGDVSMRYTTKEGGLVADRDIEIERLEMTPDEFRNEFLGEFTDGNGTVFDFGDSIMDNTPLDMKGVIAGLDIGGKIDATVLTIQNRKGDVIVQKAWTQGWTNVVDAIIETLNKYGSPTCYVETNGIGEIAYTELLEGYGNTKPWRTTNQSKKNIISELILSFNTDRIRIPRDEELLDELQYFEDKGATLNGGRKFGAKSGKHDDRVMSLAICNYHLHSMTTQVVKRTKRKISNNY